KILRHSFWRSKVTEPALRKILQAMISEQRNTVFFVDDHLNVDFSRGDDADMFRSGFPGTYRPPWRRDHPRIIGNRWIHFDLKQFSKRPTEEELLSQLPALLDQEDFSAPRESKTGKQIDDEWDRNLKETQEFLKNHNPP